jgi:hypothetical protein
LEKNDNAASHDVVKATSDKLLLPVPESEISKNPLLGKDKDPVPYTFTEEKITDLF